MTTALTSTSTTRVGAWATEALRGLLYSAAVLAWSIVGFTVWVTGVSVTASTIVLIVGVFVWIGFAHVMRWTTAVDRHLAGWLRREEIPATYRRPAERGLMPYLKTISADRKTWREFGWLALNSIVGFVIGTVVLTAAGVALAYLTMPIWFWAISDPTGQYGLTNVGLFTVDTFGESLALMGTGLVLVPIVLAIARAAAAAHAGLAARILGR